MLRSSALTLMAARKAACACRAAGRAVLWATELNWRFPAVRSAVLAMVDAADREAMVQCTVNVQLVIG